MLSMYDGLAQGEVEMSGRRRYCTSSISDFGLSAYLGVPQIPLHCESSLNSTPSQVLESGVRVEFQEAGDFEGYTEGRLAIEER